MSIIQSILFDRNIYDKKQSLLFLKKHDLKALKSPHITKKYIRIRLHNPNYKKYSYRTKTATNGVKFVIGYLKKLGGAFLDKILDEGKIFGYKIPELHLRGLSGKYNFCGPFTRLDKRLDRNRKPIKGSEPINFIDKVCMQHDIDYDDGMNKTEADKKMIETLDNTEAKTWREKVDKFAVRNFIKLKTLLNL